MNDIIFINDENDYIKYNKIKPRNKIIYKKVKFVCLRFSLVILLSAFIFCKHLVQINGNFKFLKVFIDILLQFEQTNLTFL